MWDDCSWREHRRPKLRKPGGDIRISPSITPECLPHLGVGQMHPTPNNRRLVGARQARPRLFLLHRWVPNRPQLPISNAWTTYSHLVPTLRPGICLSSWPVDPQDQQPRCPGTCDGLDARDGFEARDRFDARNRDVHDIRGRRDARGRRRDARCCRLFAARYHPDA